MSYGRLGELSFGRGGFHGYRGLGDAAYDAAVAVYSADHAAWLQEKAAYDKAAAAYAGASAGASIGYQQGLSWYNAALSQWNAANAAYQAQVLTRLRQQQQTSLAYAKATALAKSQGATIPAGYAGCVTQAQHDEWNAYCTTVKGLGLGGPVPTGPYCVLAALPVCAPAAASSLPNPGPKPVPPAPPQTFTPPAPLRPEPQPPAPPAAIAPPASAPSAPAVVTTAPSPTPPSYVAVPTPSAVLPPADDGATKKRTGGLLSNGLLLVVCGVGGYALYRTFKKPKPKAA